MASFKLKDIQPNPFRNLVKCPLDESKVEKFIRAFAHTFCWKVLMARIGPNGKPELSYGHHRIEALRRAHSPNYEIELIIEDLSDAEMLKIMADENNTDFHSSALVTMEAVRAVVQALADGKISAEEMPIEIDGTRKCAIRHAPYFSTTCEPSCGPQLGYTALSIAKFLGMTIPKGPHGDQPQKKVIAALTALEAIEVGALTEEALIREVDIGTERLFFLATEAMARYRAAAREKQDRLARIEEEKARLAKESERVRKQNEEYDLKRAADIKRAKEAADKLEQRRLEEQVRKANDEAAQKQKDILEKQKAIAKEETQVVKDFKKDVAQVRAVADDIAQGMKTKAVLADKKDVQDQWTTLDKKKTEAEKTGAAHAYDAKREGAEAQRLRDLAKKVKAKREAAHAKADAMENAEAESRVTLKVIQFAKALVGAGKKQLSIKYAQDKHQGGSKDDHQSVNAAATWLLELIEENG